MVSATLGADRLPARESGPVLSIARSPAVTAPFAACVKAPDADASATRVPAIVVSCPKVRALAPRPLSAPARMVTALPAALMATPAAPLPTRPIVPPEVSRSSGEVETPGLVRSARTAPLSAVIARVASSTSCVAEGDPEDCGPAERRTFGPRSIRPFSGSSVTSP